MRNLQIQFHNVVGVSAKCLGPTDPLRGNWTEITIFMRGQEGSTVTESFTLFCQDYEMAASLTGAINALNKEPAKVLA